MNSIKYEVSFRVRHPSMDPDEICSKLGLMAEHKWKAGSKRKTPKGKSLVGNYEFTYCVFDLKHFGSMGLADFLKFSNSRLYIHKEFFKSIRESGGSLEYFIGWFLRKDSGEIFDFELLKQLVDLGIELSIDIYSKPRE